MTQQDALPGFTEDWSVSDILDTVEEHYDRSMPLPQQITIRHVGGPQYVVNFAIKNDDQPYGFSFFLE